MIVLLPACRAGQGRPFQISGRKTTGKLDTCHIARNRLHLVRPILKFVTNCLPEIPVAGSVVNFSTVPFSTCTDIDPWLGEAKHVCWVFQRITGGYLCAGTICTVPAFM